MDSLCAFIPYIWSGEAFHEEENPYHACATRQFGDRQTRAVWGGLSCERKCRLHEGKVR